MAIKPKCDRCKNELLDYGAILLSPPNTNSTVKKFHICKECYKIFLKEIKKKNNKAAK